MTHTIFQDDSNQWRVQAFVDSYVLSEENGNVIFLSMFGSTLSVKSLTAQILNNRDNIHIKDGFDRIIKTKEDHRFISVHKGSSILKSYNRNIKPGITQKVLFSEDCFVPWKSEHNNSKLFIFGKTEQEAKERAFKIIDKCTLVPLKLSWVNWLWNKVIEYNNDRPYFEQDICTGGELPSDMKVCKFVQMPSSDWLESEVRENFKELASMN